MHPFYESLDDGPDTVKRRYELSVYDDDNEELVYSDTWYSDESMQEDLRKVDHAFDQHERELAELNSPDEDTAYDSWKEGQL